MEVLPVMVEQQRAIDRRELIISAALRVIVDRGVHATTHRAIAEQAGVPLGSLTYYFDGLTQLIEQAFVSLYELVSAGPRRALTDASNLEEAIDAVTDIICGGNRPSADQERALLELYSYANHNLAAAEVCTRWLATTRELLAAHFCEQVSEALDALIEGWSIHQHFRAEPARRDAVRAVIAAITAAHHPDHGDCTGCRT